MKGKHKHVATASTASIHQKAQATLHQSPPHAGTQTKQIILMIVANPIGKQPRKRLCAGCRIMAPQIFGYSVYRSRLINENMTNNSTFRANMM